MPRITPAIAREYAAKSLVARLKHHAELVQAANPVPLPADNSYVQRRLARVREQIERIAVMLETEDDAQCIDRLASATGRLSEIERQLSMRPMPGALKPVQDKRRSLLSQIPAIEVAAVAPTIVQPAPDPIEPATSSTVPVPGATDVQQLGQK